VKVSPDGKFVAAAGVYKPQIKVYEADQLSMKFERHVDGEVVQMQFLESDYKKLCLLRADRTSTYVFYVLNMPSFYSVFPS